MGAARVLVTGGTGFVGSAFIRRALDHGFSVAALVRPDVRVARHDAMGHGVQLIHASLETLTVAKVRAEIAKFQPDIMVHLAWSGVRSADRNSLSQFDNVQYALDLMGLAQDCGVEQFIGLGSQAEYGPCSQRISTSQSTNPTTLYGVAKLSVYHALRCLAAKAEFKYAWLRLFSSYGPGDDPNWMIQYLIRALLKRERPALTACEQQWDYIFVDDVADAIISVIEKRTTGLFNLGAGTAYRLRDVVELIRDLVDPSLDIGFGEIPYRPDQVMHLEADIDDLRRETGWQPRVSLKDGIARTVERARSASQTANA